MTGFISYFVGCVFFLSFMSNTAVARPTTLQKSIDSLLTAYHAKVGVALIYSGSGEKLSVNNSHRYVMQSVYKFHLALTVFHQVDQGLLSLDQKVFISKEEVGQKTWSPIATAYPEGNVSLSIRELLSYTISQSDNIGCDILFRLVGGTSVVQKYINSLGIRSVSIKKTEQEMHLYKKNQYTNWTTPLAAAELLEKSYTTSLLSDSSRSELWNMMTATTTGPKRIKGLLPTSAIVAHKTGSSGQDNNGLIVAQNDIGVITLPNGQYIALAVFVNSSKESSEVNDEIIAKVARLVWDYYSTDTQAK